MLESIKYLESFKWIFRGMCTFGLTLIFSKRSSSKRQKLHNSLFSVRSVLLLPRTVDVREGWWET